MKLKPAGYFVLVDVTESEKVTEGGIVLPKDLTQKEQAVEETGILVAIGPTAYVGMRGCTEEDMARTGKSAAELWGVKLGDRVEFRKYEGKNTSVDEDFPNYRYIPDTHIMGVIADE
jgi:chaperonin GroES